MRSLELFLDSFFTTELHHALLFEVTVAEDNLAAWVSAAEGDGLGLFGDGDEGGVVVLDPGFNLAGHDADAEVVGVGWRCLFVDFASIV